MAAEIVKVESLLKTRRVWPLEVITRICKTTAVSTKSPIRLRGTSDPQLLPFP